MQTSPTRSSSAAPRLGRVGAFLTAFAVAATVWSAAPAGAATRNPCRLLTVSQIESVLEQSTTAGTPDLSTQVLKSCRFQLTAEQGKPGGGVHTSLMTIGGDIAFNVNSKRPGSELVPGLGKAYYSAVTTFSGAVHVLKGKTLMTVELVYVPAGGPAVDASLIKDETIQLAKMAKHRF
jgi:hypothetical protein